MATSAERQRRYRRHLKGDHTLCDPGRGCAEPAPPPPSIADEPAAEGTAADQAPSADAQRLGARGAALWQAMHDVGLGPAHRVLLEEACRLADRLDRLDAMVEGREEWIRLRSRDEDQTTYVVVVDGLLSEARQHATTLRGLVAELRAALPKTPARPSAPKQKGGLGDLSSRIAARRAASAG